MFGFYQTYSQDIIDTICINNKIGFKNKENDSIIIKPIYDKVSNYFDYCNYAFVSINNKWGVIKKDGTYIINIEFDEVNRMIFDNLFIDDIFKVKQNEKYGLIDKLGDTILNLEYLEIESIFNNVIAIKIKNNVWKIVDKKGKQINDFEFENIKGYYSECGIKINGKWGVMNDSLNIILPCIYDSIINPFLVNKFIVLNEKKGVVNNQNKVIIPFEYEEIKENYYDNNLYIVKKHNDYGLIDTNNDIIIPFLYEEIKEISKNHIILRKKNKWSICNFNKKKYSDFVYDKIIKLGYLSNLLLAYKNDKIGVVDFTGKIIIDFKYDKIKQFNDTLILAFKDSKITLFNKNGVQILKFNFDNIENSTFNNEFDYKLGFKIENNNINYLYDSSFKLIYKTQYEIDKNNIINDYCIVKIKKKFEICNLKKNKVTNNCYDTIISVPEDMMFGKVNYPYKAIKDKKVWFVDFKGEKICDMFFDIQKDEDNLWYDNLIIVFKNSKYGVLDLKGMIVVPIEFDKRQILKKLNE